MSYFDGLETLRGLTYRLSSLAPDKRTSGLRLLSELKTWLSTASWIVEPDDITQIVVGGSVSALRPAGEGRNMCYVTHITA